MTKDPIIFGILSGFAGNAVKQMVEWPLHFLGYIRYTCVHIAAGYFVSAEFIDNPISLATGFITDWTMAGVFGVLLLNLIRRTGHDYAVIKGIGFASVIYVAFFGAVMALDVTRASLLTPLPNLLLFFPHMIFGAVIGWFIQRFDPVVN